MKKNSFAKFLMIASFAVGIFSQNINTVKSVNWQTTKSYAKRSIFPASVVTGLGSLIYILYRGLTDKSDLVHKNPTELIPKAENPTEVENPTDLAHGNLSIPDPDEFIQKGENPTDLAHGNLSIPDPAELTQKVENPTDLVHGNLPIPDSAALIPKVENPTGLIDLVNGNLSIPDPAELIQDDREQRVGGFNTYPLFAHVPDASDIKQCGEETCYLLSALLSLAKCNPAFICSMMKNLGSGWVVVRLYDLDSDDSGQVIGFKPKYIKVWVNDLIAKNSLDYSVFWVEIIKKAYSIGEFNRKNSSIYYNGLTLEKRRKHYDAFRKDSEKFKSKPRDIDMGFSYLTFMNLLGCRAVEKKVCDIIEIDPNSVYQDKLNQKYDEKDLQLFDYIKAYLDSDKPAVAVFKNCARVPMPGQHAYAVVGCRKVGNYKFIDLVDPFRGKMIPDAMMTRGGESDNALPGIKYIKRVDGTYLRTHTSETEKLAIELSDFSQILKSIELLDGSMAATELRIPELDVSGEIPVTLRNFASHERARLEQIYAAIGNDAELRRKINLIENFLKQMIDSDANYFAVQVTPQAVKPIFSDGEIKNRFGVGEHSTAAGRDRDAVRENTSHRLFGCPFLYGDNKSHYEKFGYLCLSNVGLDIRTRKEQIQACIAGKKIGCINNNNVSNYGGVIVILDKEKVKTKTTITFGDSIKSPMSDRIASMVTDPKISFLVDLDFDNKVGAIPQRINDCYDAIMTCNPNNCLDVYRRILGARTAKEYNWFVAKIHILANSNYFELQFHGKLGIEDAQKIVINKEVVENAWVDELTTYLTENNWVTVPSESNENVITFVRQ
ncbi:MAG: hypothetical protein LBR79_05145 [Oscillospiraceae bacterium]|jgi:hypothetical protein|nr:hypothetical protein [Oscillospiraceae bacterium]